jgi:hypothetical protein
VLETRRHPIGEPRAERIDEQRLCRACGCEELGQFERMRPGGFDDAPVAWAACRMMCDSRDPFRIVRIGARRRNVEHFAARIECEPFGKTTLARTHGTRYEGQRHASRLRAQGTRACRR